jgi:integrase
MYNWYYSQIEAAYIPRVMMIYNNISRYYGSFFIALYETGCRPVELLDRDRWSRRNLTEFDLITAKGSEPRIIRTDQLTKEIISAIDDTSIDLPSFFRISRRTCERFFYDYFFPDHWFFEDNDLKGSQGMYIFRHIFVKRLIAEGMTISDVAAILGEVDLKNIQGYAGSQAFSPVQPQ